MQKPEKTRNSFFRVVKRTRGSACALRCTPVCSYPRVPLCTPVYPCVPLCTPVYPCVPLCTPVYPCAHLFTTVYPCVPLCTPVHPYVSLCTPVYPRTSVTKWKTCSMTVRVFAPWTQCQNQQRFERGSSSQTSANFGIASMGQTPVRGDAVSVWEHSEKNIFFFLYWYTFYHVLVHIFDSRIVRKATKKEKTY